MSGAERHAWGLRSGAEGVRRRAEERGMMCNSRGLTLACVVTLMSCLAAPAAGQQCGADFIAFPDVQCVDPCPRNVQGGDIECPQQEAQIDITANNTKYCCLCVAVDGNRGVFESRICPNSADPAPQLQDSPVYRVSAGISLGMEQSIQFDASSNVPNANPQGPTAEVTFPANYILSADTSGKGAYESTRWFKMVNPGGWGSTEYLQIRAHVVAATPSPAPAPTPTNSSGDVNGTSVNATGNGTSNSTRRLLSTALAAPAPSSELFSSSYGLTEEGLVHLEELEQTGASEILCVGGLQTAGVELSGLKGASVGGQVVRACLSGSGGGGRRERRAGFVGQVVIDVVKGGVPTKQTLEQGAGFFHSRLQRSGDVQIVNPTNSVPWWVGMRSKEGSWSVSLDFQRMRMIELKDEVETTFEVPARGRIFCRFVSPKEGIVVLKRMLVTNPVSSPARVYVNYDAFATSRQWLKWVSGNDTEVNENTNTFFTSVHVGQRLGIEAATWTFMNEQALTWKIIPAVVQSVDLELDRPQTFTIDKQKAAALFKLKNSDDLSRQVYFQIMPAPNQESMTQYAQWVTLDQAVFLRVSFQQNGATRLGGVTDKGFTSDGTAALRAGVDNWDKGSDVWLQIFLTDTRLNGDFTIVCYQMGDALDTWKWWFGGIVFAIFIFCVIRCVVCRHRGAHPMLFGLPPHYGPDGQPLPNGELPIELVTTTEPVPDKLIKINNSLYKRIGTPALNSSVQEAPAGDGAEGADAAADPPLSVAVPVDAGGAGEEGTPPPDAEGGGGDTEEGPMAPPPAPNLNLDDDDDNTCIVCLDRERDALLLECGHGGLCVDCATALWNNGPSGRTCPMCRKIFTGVMKLLGDDEAPPGEGQPEGQTIVRVEMVHYAMRPDRLPPAQRGGIQGLFNRRGQLPNQSGPLATPEAMMEGGALPMALLVPSNDPGTLPPAAPGDAIGRQIPPMNLEGAYGRHAVAGDVAFDMSASNLAAREATSAPRHRPVLSL